MTVEYKALALEDVHQGPFGLAATGVLAEGIPTYGCCDPRFRDSTSIALLNAFYSKVMFTLTNGVDGLSLAAGTDRVAFGYGEDEAATEAGFPAGWIASGAETNLSTSGAFGRRNEAFIITGFAMTVEAPFYCDEEATPPAKVYAPEIVQDAGAPYDERIITALIQNLFAEVEIDGQNCDYALGTLDMWPQIGGATGDGVITNGTPLALNIMPLRAALVGFGGRNEASQMTVHLKVTEMTSLVIGNNGIDLEDDVCVTVKLQAFGFPVCAMDVNACGVPGADVALIDARIAAALAANQLPAGRRR